jgi:hypothetical protein
MGGVVAAWVVERARRKAVLQGARPIAANILWRRPQTGEGWSCWGGKMFLGVSLTPRCLCQGFVVSGQ